MGIFDKVCGKFGLIDTESELDFEDDEMEEAVAPPKAQKLEPPRVMRQSPQHPGNVVDIHEAGAAIARANVKMRVVVIEPRSFDDVQQVANCLKEKKPVVINFEHTDAADAKRIIDFASGATYALAGDMKKVGPNVFMCAPSNVNVSYSQERGSFASSDMSWLKK